jgi:dipeptidyl aminopeptidase/acylaminoacyl peptidase
MTKFIISSGSDKNPGAYYYYDSSTDKLTNLGDLMPWLDASKMSEMKPISYKSRDGLTIHGYLTLPANKIPSNLPVIVNPHGGPWARDVWGYNPEVQFLANRGYAVLQINFRGSTGYGKKFVEAGNKQWGLKMQDDITDGVQWLIKQGIADAKKVGIYGGSYGGYATLAGITFTPDLYAAAVDYVGVSNIFTLLNTIPPYWESQRKMFYERVGDPVKDKDLLTKVSPVFHADKIKTPLFVAQGANDPRVNKAESDQIVDALKKRGINVQYMVKDNEGHGFANQENRFDFYKAMEEFFEKHLQ